MDPPPHRERQRVVGALQRDADAVLHAARGAAATAERDQQAGPRQAVPSATWRGRPPTSAGGICARRPCAYEWLIANDVARELARIDLPLSTYTQWYWKIDLHNLLHFLTLRVDAHAQWEIQEFGAVMAGMLKRVAPLSYEAWIDYDVCGARLSRAEVQVLRLLLRTDRVVLDTGVRYVGPSHGDSSVTAPQMSDLGMSKREVDEFCDRLEDGDHTTPDFSLDLSAAKPASYFEAEAAAASKSR